MLIRGERRSPHRTGLPATAACSLSAERPQMIATDRLVDLIDMRVDVALFRPCGHFNRRVADHVHAEPVATHPRPSPALANQMQEMPHMPSQGH
jgi:hypothetical protein